MRPTKPLVIWGPFPVKPVSTLRSPAADPERQESSSSPLRGRDLGRHFSHWAKAILSMGEQSDLILPLSSEPLGTSQRAVLIKDKKGENKKRKNIYSWVFMARARPLTNVRLILQSLDYEPLPLKTWTCSEVFWLIAHLRRGHIHPRPQRTSPIILQDQWPPNRQSLPGTQENKTTWT